MDETAHLVIELVTFFLVGLLVGVAVKLAKG